MENKAAGCITAPANIISPELRKVWDLMREGKDASAAQAHVTEIREILDKYPPFPPTLKAMLHRLHDLPRWQVKPPLVEITEAMEHQLANELAGIQQ
jgi:dihydrodipicolinate synthase/N-acetylneuraminate lyase